MVNGQKYYYAVVSYDHGDAELLVAPVECSKTITVNPETGEVLLDVNTVAVVPRTMTAGYVASSFTDSLPTQIQGNGTGLINLDIIDHTAIEDQNSFQIIFSEEGGLNYSVLDQKEVSDTLVARPGNYHKLSYQNVDSLTFELFGSNGTLLNEGSDYDLLDTDGQILIHADGAISESEQIIAKFIYYPIKNSNKLALEEGNPIFDGMTLTVQNQILELDEGRIGWNQDSPNNWEPTVKPFNNLGTNRYPADYELRWFEEAAVSYTHLTLPTTPYV